MKDTKIRCELRSEAYAQHYNQFRDLNGHMWKIPMIALTLTGGLWLGVNTASGDTLVQALLLFLSGAANLILIIVLLRIRHIMKCILEKLKEMGPEYFVEIPPDGFLGMKNLVVYCFSSILLLSSLMSFLYFVSIILC